MPDIHRTAGIELRPQGDRVIAVPLDSSVTQEWRHRYDSLTRVRDVPATAVEREQAWIVVSVPIDAERTSIEATMNAARQLITKIQGDDQSAAEAESTIRECWARQQR